MTETSPRIPSAVPGTGLDARLVGVIPWPRDTFGMLGLVAALAAGST